jgi:hypothetical protein
VQYLQQQQQQQVLIAELVRCHTSHQLQMITSCQQQQQQQ